MRTKRLVAIAALITLLGGTGCETILEIASPATDSPFPTQTQTADPTPTAIPPTLIETTEEASPVPTPVESCPVLGAVVLEKMNQIESQVVQLRGLPPQGSVKRDLLTKDQLRVRVREDFLAEYTEAEATADAYVLSLFGLIEPDFDLWSLYADLLAEQVAGFYDISDQEMVVICETGFGGLERVTYAHEYAHTLQDQTFKLEEVLAFNDEACDLEGQRCVAIQALLEGDATLLQEQWLRTFALEDDEIDLLEFFDTFEMPVFDSAPTYLQKELTFPYLSGLRFVRALYVEGGWAAVDRAYSNPPISSEQILHPDRYPADLPIDLAVPELASELGPGWQEIKRDVMGEWLLQMVLDEYLEKEVAIDGTVGWGGDIYVALANEEEVALVVVIQLDSMRDAHEFAAAFLEYGTARFGEPEISSTTSANWLSDNLVSIFERRSNQGLWILASDLAIAEALFEAIPLPVPEG